MHNSVTDHMAREMTSELLQLKPTIYSILGLLSSSLICFRTAAVSGSAKDLGCNKHTQVVCI